MLISLLSMLSVTEELSLENTSQLRTVTASAEAWYLCASRNVPYQFYQNKMFKLMSELSVTFESEVWRTKVLEFLAK